MKIKLFIIYHLLFLLNFDAAAEIHEIKSRGINGQFSETAPAEEVIVLSFSHERGYYSEPFQLFITSNTDTPDIIYTTDCSTPSATNGTVYKNSILIDSTILLKAVAISESGTSEVFTQSYLFIDDISRQKKAPEGFPLYWGGSSIIPADYEMDPEIIHHPDYDTHINDAFLSIPSLSLSMNTDDWFNHSTGLYVGYPNTHISREKAVHAEFIFPGTEESFSLSCGVKNQGGTSIVNWKSPKQSMRLLFKNPYGPTRLNYKLFPDSDINSINTLVVDALLYSWIHPWDNKQRVTSLYFRDQLCSDLQNKMGWNSFHGIYVHLFINGLYWGIYDLHERPDDAFMAWYLKGTREDFDIIKHNPDDVVSGSNASYNQMLYVARNGFKTYEHLKNFQNYLDIPAFIDYMLLNFYLGNFDWAHQNYYASVNRTDMSGFRFYTWDAEFAMRYSDVNYNNTQKNNEGSPTEIHTLLKENEEYRMMFADAVYKHCFNKGALTPDSFLESFMYRKNEVDKAIILESARWGDFLEGETGVTYNRNDYWLPEVEKAISEYIPKRRDIFVNQLRSSSNKLFPMVMPPSIETEQNEPPTTILITLVNKNSTDGEIWFTTDGSDPRLPGGTASGQKYSGPIKVENNILLKARFKSGKTGEWSALTEERFVINPDKVENLVITEIMYNPEEGFPEFIELTNTGQDVIFLNGFSFTKGIAYSFNSDESVPPGEGIVLTNDTLLFLQSYRFRANGQFRKKLSNQSDTLILQNFMNLITDSVSYSSSAPWPIIQGDGKSIELIDHSLDNSYPENWKVSDVKNGTPFHTEVDMPWKAMIYPNPVKDFATIHLSEPALAFSKFRIEIFNPTGLLIKEVNAQSNNSRITIRMDTMSGSFYFIKLIPENKSFEVLVFKVVKINY